MRVGVWGKGRVRFVHEGYIGQGGDLRILKMGGVLLQNLRLYPPGALTRNLAKKSSP